MLWNFSKGWGQALTGEMDNHSLQFAGVMQSLACILNFTVWLS